MGENLSPGGNFGLIRNFMKRALSSKCKPAFLAVAGGRVGKRVGGIMSGGSTCTASAGIDDLWVTLNDRSMKK